MNATFDSRSLLERVRELKEAAEEVEAVSQVLKLDTPMQDALTRLWNAAKNVQV